MRAEQLWKIIRNAVDFKDKTVVDLGCGYGDLLWRMALYSSQVLGVDRDPRALKDAKSRAESHSVSVKLIHQELERWLTTSQKTFDIALCLSVMPYLELTYHETLKLLKEKAMQVVIELQYFEDGPGRPEVKNDQDMKALLLRYWTHVEAIGWTLVKEGRFIRTVWLCEKS